MSNNERRRTTGDRREEDFGPPAGWSERRKRVERRIPVTAEVEVSQEEWELYFGATVRGETTATNVVTVTHHHDADFIDVFSRVRD